MREAWLAEENLETQRVGRGGWITASFGIGAEEFGADGELVAVDEDSLYVPSDGASMRSRFLRSGRQI